MSADSLDRELEWLIIGGGIHGVHVAARLIGEAAVPPERVRIVDPAARLLARWRECTATTGMTHLRSPCVHHLGLSPWALRRFTDERGQLPGEPALFAPPYDRPSLAVFDAHCDHVIARFGLDACHLRDRATRCALTCEGVELHTAGGLELRAENLVLAMGASEQPHWPAWAPRDDARIQHIFAADFGAWPSAAERETVAVVGGGITAAQVALRLVDDGHRVHLVSRHALREHQFDSDPGWLGPRFMRGFSQEPDLDRRRAMIRGARHRGSVPPDVHRALVHAIDSGQVSWHQTRVEALTAGREAPLRLELATSDPLEVQRVLLATGFAPQRPGGAMIDALVASASLPCASCGYPIVDEALRWHPRVYVTGPLAELELGPVSRNIAGARRAGDRLLAHLAAPPKRSAAARKVS
ncbi:FAD/NAD(P)-binding protein [Pseudenhygromyxa sp. WMMC2535]|uniref:FAD/NAD(P)-binding protein n=1 Tax=Pseudenhygromyxa sp. WMMC2535 TaxID=2712867 RepID=UPI0015528EEB|nr:FAD/NAD(P)-binding protein [Pseudenhygromyxa sp. WMMC2535]NVB37018.1 FAD/NAD(P)-binding protein [Pseudenhygromyxa sp. WMMC2535]